MRSWKDAITEGAIGGSIAALLSAAVVTVAGKKESGSAIAPINAVSHWLWGDEAALQEDASAKYTGVGAVTHVLSAMFWATLHAKVRPAYPQRPVLSAIAGGAATSAVATALDYGLIPKRLTPGFEHRLSTASLAGALAAIGAGIAIGAVLADSRRHG